MVEAITLTEAKALKVGQTVYAIWYYNSDGTAQRFRVQGTKNLKRNSERMEVTLKRGLKEYVTLNEWCLDEFSLEEPEPIQKPRGVKVFELTDLEEHFGKNMEINGSIYMLEKIQDLSGVLAVWKNDSYLIYAIPMYEGVAVPFYIVDCNNQEIGTDGHYTEIDSYERYCKIVKVLAEKIIKRARM